MALTPKQRLFVDEYLIDLNATQAAIRAGYSKATAKSIGQENLTKPDIAKAIEGRIGDRQKRIELTQDKVLSDIEKVKRHAMGEGYDAQGNKVMNNYHAALKACELEAKHLGMLREKVELTGNNGAPIATTDMSPKQFEEIAKKIASEV